MALPKGPFYQELGRRLREARKSAKLTQADLAGATHLSRTSITNIENGRQPIDVHVLAVIADLLHIEDLRKLVPDLDPNVQGALPKGLDELQPEKQEWIRRILRTTIDEANENPNET